MAKLTYLPPIYYDEKVHKKMLMISGSEMVNSDKACYYGKLNRYYNDLLESVHINRVHVNEFKNKNISEKYKSFSLLNDDFTIFLIMCTIALLRKGQDAYAYYWFNLITLKFHASSMHKFFQFCNPDAFLVALDQLSHKHLYKAHGGVASSLKYLSVEEFKKNKAILASTTFTDDDLVKIIYMLRTRITQSIRSFAEIYYEVSATPDKSGGKDPEIMDRIEMAIDKIAMNMCVYGQNDTVAAQQAIAKSGIRKEIGSSIMADLLRSEFKEDVRFILILTHRMAAPSGLKNVCVETKRNNLIRKMISGMKINDYSVKEQILNLIRKLPNSYLYRNIYEQQLLMFFCHYITIYLKNRIC
jgi:hypothetical protein